MAAVKAFLTIARPYLRFLSQTSGLRADFRFYIQSCPLALQNTGSRSLGVNVITRIFRLRHFFRTFRTLASARKWRNALRVKAALLVSTNAHKPLQFQLPYRLPSLLYGPGVSNHPLLAFLTSISPIWSVKRSKKTRFCITSAW